MENLNVYLKSFSILKKMYKPNHCAFDIIRAGMKGEKVLDKEVIKIYKHYFKNEIEALRQEGFTYGEKADPIIWVCWWQGEEKMPPVVKTCFARLKALNPDKKVILITEKNVGEYLDLDKNVVDAVKNGSITLTFFSDYLRSSLIYKYGGLWVDSTLFFFDSIPNEYFDKPLISIHQEFNGNEIALGKWTGFFLGAGYKNCSYIKYLQTSLKKLIDNFCFNPYYFSIDVILRSAYDLIPDITKVIDALPYSSPDIHCMPQLWNKPCDRTFLNQLCEKNDMLKLNAKWEREEGVNLYHNFFESEEAVEYRFK